ncbi:MAG: biotin carboxylase N-terminal domain-containing protein, partial [Planctomycetota bacterium]
MARKFKKILIANRGEIAVRIIKTCKKMGIQTVAVYSQADKELLPVRLADEAVCIGPFRSKESYLQMDAVLQAAQQTECQAIHPGYGFLSENALFSELCRQHGFTFIGPTPKQIRRMGNKTEAKLAAKEGGLPLIPGSTGVLLNAKEGKTLANEIHYPVLLKARAGGGGRGMRIVRQESQFEDLFQEATLESTSAFGDGALYLEKLLVHARHIEVQVAMDAYGNGIHLGIRDCSIQRKHQKLIEESPSPILQDDFINRLGNQVIHALKKIGYLNLGTVEFLMTPEQQCYFIEMNTRLQVEHPVTENICNLDLVQLQIELAANHPLPWTQEQIRRQGHSIECRINAEDPALNFKPSP